MRWYWIDRFVELTSGRRAVAVKNVTLAEDYLHDHVPGAPVFPAALMIEGMAQTAGILVGEARGFRENVILAKIRQAVFHEEARPGDQLTYEATLESLDDRGAVTSGVVRRGGGVLAEIDLMFSHVRPGERRTPIPEGNFVFTGPILELISGLQGCATIPGNEGSVKEARRSS